MLANKPLKRLTAKRWTDMRRSHLPFWVLLPILIAGCDGILVVNGRVLDETGKAISGAKVSVYSAMPSVLADDTGCFHVAKITGWSKHDAAFLVEARGYQTYLGKVTAPGIQQVIVRLPIEGGNHYGSIEKLAVDPSCPAHRGDAAHKALQRTALARRR
jgi:hypothetical protein